MHHFMRHFLDLDNSLKRIENDYKRILIVSDFKAHVSSIDKIGRNQVCNRHIGRKTLSHLLVLPSVQSA